MFKNGVQRLMIREPLEKYCLSFRPTGEIFFSYMISQLFFASVRRVESSRSRRFFETTIPNFSASLAKINSRLVCSISVILFVIMVTAGNSAFAQNNLHYYLDAAIKNNPSLNENLNNIAINEIDKTLAERQFVYPQISLTSNYMFSPYFNNGGKLVTVNPEPNAVGYDIGITNGGLYSVLMNVEKNIFNGGTVEAYKSQSELKIQNAVNSNSLLKHNLEKDVIDQYLYTVRSQKISEIEKTLYDTIKTQLSITEELVEKGLAKQSDYLLLKIEVENERIACEQAQNEFKKNLSDLNTLCGIKDANSVQLEDAELRYENVPGSSNFLKQFTIDSLTIDNQQKVFETKYAPQLNLFFNTGLNAVELEGIQKKFGLSAGINFSMPIYDGSQKSLIRQQTDISLKSIKAYKESQIVTLINKMAQAKAGTEFYKENLKSLSEQIANYEELMKIAHAEFVRGQKSMTDYLILIRNYLEMKKNYVGIENGYWQAINLYNYWNW